MVKSVKASLLGLCRLELQQFESGVYPLSQLVSAPYTFQYAVFFRPSNDAHQNRSGPVGTGLSTYTTSGADPD